MKDEILNNLDNPGKLESLYRINKNLFQQTFLKLYPEIKGDSVAEVWCARLSYSESDVSWGSKKELIFVLIASLLAFAIAKIPVFTEISEDYFYVRNLAFIFLPFLILYFILKEKPNWKIISFIGGVLLFSCLYMNILPNKEKSDSIILACIFMPFVSWSLLGLSFVGDEYKNSEKRLRFLSYNGDLVVMTTLILIAGVILTFITFALFQAIGVEIMPFYMQYIVVAGLVASPIVATYLIQQNPWLVNKISPVIAKVFTPLVLVTLVVYLVSVIIYGINPFTDRNSLIVFNFLLIGVMAIIFFSIAGTKEIEKSKFELMMLFFLAVITIIVNSIALSAILYRITEWGFTPNRLAVLGTNIIVLVHLLLVTYCLFTTLRSKKEIVSVENSIVRYLPVYSAWSMIVVFLFPLIYQMQ